MTTRYDMVLYHGGCSDGFCCAWLASRSGQCDGAELIPVNYGQPPPDVTGKQVLIADFSYPRDVTIGLCRVAKCVTILDHHATAKKELEPLIFSDTNFPGSFQPPFIVFDMAKSGAMLTWEHFHPGEKPPRLVEYVQDRDLWQWKLPMSREVNAAIRSYPMDLEVWDSFFIVLRDGNPALHDQGSAILRYQNQIVADQVRHATEQNVAGHLVPCVNATVLISEIAGELAKGKEFAACWFERADGKRQFSLRSDENGLDVSAIAKKMGGGGHPRAAGFEINLIKRGLQWTFGTQFLQ